MSKEFSPSQVLMNAGFIGFIDNKYRLTQKFLDEYQKAAKQLDFHDETDKMKMVQLAIERIVRNNFPNVTFWEEIDLWAYLELFFFEVIKTMDRDKESDSDSNT